MSLTSYLNFSEMETFRKENDFNETIKISINFLLIKKMRNLPNQDLSWIQIKIEGDILIVLNSQRGVVIRNPSNQSIRSSEHYSLKNKIRTLMSELKSYLPGSESSGPSHGQPAPGPGAALAHAPLRTHSPDTPPPDQAEQPHVLPGLDHAAQEVDRGADGNSNHSNSEVIHLVTCNDNSHIRSRSILSHESLSQDYAHLNDVVQGDLLLSENNRKLMMMTHYAKSSGTEFSGQIQPVICPLTNYCTKEDIILLSEPNKLSNSLACNIPGEADGQPAVCD